mmetsp:Transcript_27437/g.65868  ORF Transcript_27437/g.65868 Transcript_27437/m.65868 type:complete len:86 (+) Transcript_27437:1391-1648(+)
MADEEQHSVLCNNKEFQTTPRVFLSVATIRSVTDGSTRHVALDSLARKGDLVRGTIISNASDSQRPSIAHFSTRLSERNRGRSTF